MKRIAILLLTISTLTAQFLFAQTCPASATYTNQSGSFDLVAGKTILLNNGGSFQITIQNNFSSTSSICVLNGSKLTLMFQNVNSMGKGGFINVDKNSTLTIGGSGINNFPLTINNNGITTQATTITYADGAAVNNTGIYTISSAATLNSGAVTFTNSGSLSLSAALNYNNGTFTMSNAVNSTIAFSSALTLSSTTINNSGTINCSGNVTLQGSSVVTNKGYMYMSGDLSFSGATFSNYGVLYISGTTIVNTGSTFNNYCTIKETGNFGNNGTMTNTGNLILVGSFTNQGSFVNGSTAQVQGSNFTNNSTVTGSGNFLFTGLTTNQGPFNGTSASSKINFYDASLISSNYFDVQNTTPTNISKNVVVAIIATVFTSCAEVSAPVITAQPSSQTFCSTSTNSTVTFSVTATGTPSYQWYKNGSAISGATSSSYTATGLTIVDTVNAYTVAVTNSVGTTTSNSASVKYYITSQPSSLYLATGNAASFAIQTSGATAWQWQKNSTNISGATSMSYSLAVVNQSDSGSYKAVVTYSGGTCTSDIATLKTSIILYSKSTGNLNLPATWGVATDGSGSTPVNFTRDEHTYIVSNRTTASTVADLTIAGTFDVANAKVTIPAGTTLTAGRAIRSSSLSVVNAGAFVGSSSSNLSLTGIATTAYAGTSDLYFDASGNTLKNLTIAAHTVTIRSALNITSGSAAGVVTVNSGTLATSDILTLKSDVNGTASIGSSAGTITGKVTIEKYIHARRAWRLMGAPITSVSAPTINAAWQEGATSSTANPAPGFGTHITYGLESEGFDQNPQKTFSMRLRNSSNAWVGVPATNKTTITDYPAYFLFIRGNRSYDIKGTTNVTAPTTTVLRVTGNVNQGTQAAKAVAATGYTLVANPYAAPINFTKLKSSNVKARIRVWDPTLAGAKGVGGWVILDGTNGVYKATPSSSNVSTLLQAGQGFFVESNDGVNSGSLIFGESSKDLSGATLGADRVGEMSGDTSLAINLKLFNEDSTTAITDGVLFNFNKNNSDSVNNDDAAKMNNFGENLSIKESSLLTISDRTMPKEGDSLHLSLTNAKDASYQMEIIPSSLKDQSFSLYDRYLNTFAPISSSDTTRITFSVNNSIDASKAADRFTIVVNKATVKPVVSKAGITSVKASAKDKAISVEWNVSNESGVAYYEVQKSADGNTFSAAGNVAATGSSSYSFTDSKPGTAVNYYRVKSVNKTGVVSYTSIVSAELQAISATGVASVGVYPNPLTGSTFTLTLSNMEAGAYTLTVVNSNGSTQFTKAIQHNGGTASQKVSLSHTLAAGIYYVKVTSAIGNVNMVKIIAQ